MTKSNHTYRTEDIAYLAGIIDGEGTFNIYKSRLQKHTGRLYVVNTYFPLIDWLQITFGGLVYKRNHKKWKTRYEWILEKEYISDICQMILPFLKIKTEQAKIMIEFRQTFSNTRKRLSSQTLSNRETLYLNLKLLNHRSI